MRRAIPLSPAGAVRRQFGQLLGAKSDPLEHSELREAVGDGPWLAARELALCVEDQAARPAVLILAAAALWTAERGSTRMPIGTPQNGPLRSALEELAVSPKRIIDVFNLIEAARSGTCTADEVIGRRGEYRPLLIDGDAVCVQRMVSLEEELGDGLRKRLRSEGGIPYSAATVKTALADVLKRAPVVGGSAVALSDEQQRAVLAAAHLPLTVISGGPGTGKTSIVASVLRMLVRFGTPVEQIGLAAPTGKAANRMAESIGNYLRAIPDRTSDDDVLLEHTPEPMTLHRLLGYSPSKDRFQHHAQNPLAQEVVIVDEASMIDLSLMNQLVRSVKPTARLVLLGDAEQLPSVDAGAVLRDLVPADARRFPRPWDALVKSEDAAVESDDLRHRAAVRLTKSYRMREDDPAGRAMYLVAQQVRAGEMPPIGSSGAEGRILPRPTAAEVGFSAVELVPASAQREAFLDRWFQERVVGGIDFEGLVRREYVCVGGEFTEEDEAALTQLHDRLQRSRLLCLTRSETRPSGTGSINAALRERLLAVVGSEDAGEPVLMTHNDYTFGLFNGDQGVLLRVRHEHELRHQLRFVFPVKGRFKAFERGALKHQVVPAWAMTVHKSQGSEFDHVALVLPDAEERAQGGEARSLLVREIVYTAMTRARKSVTLLGDAEALQEAVERTIERYSALGDAAFWK